jgi:hypothetical protein
MRPDFRNARRRKLHCDITQANAGLHPLIAVERIQSIEKPRFFAAAT